MFFCSLDSIQLMPAGCIGYEVRASGRCNPQWSASHNTWLPRASAAGCAKRNYPRYASCAVTMHLQ